MCIRDRPPHSQVDLGKQTMVSLTSSLGSSLRPLPTCPTCAPCFKPLLRLCNLIFFLCLPKTSVDGGNDELVGLVLSFSSSAVSLAVNTAPLIHNSAIS